VFTRPPWLTQQDRKECDLDDGNEGDGDEPDSVLVGHNGSGCPGKEDRQPGTWRLKDGCQQQRDRIVGPARKRARDREKSQYQCLYGNGYSKRGKPRMLSRKEGGTHRVAA